MVYYGAVSKGCQKCRQRKIKCDQRKPKCLRCEKAKVSCPGYRDLGNVLFRDESERIIRKSNKSYVEDNPHNFYGESLVVQEKVIPANLEADNSMYFTIPFNVLSQPANELGAHFFFANYTCDEPPLSKDYHSWLINSYFEDCSGYALREAIDAAGMAGISNKFYAPDLVSKSRLAYGRALLATKQALSDPIESKADSTLTTVILLGVYELITCDNWEQYRSWVAHIQGATALLQHRGTDQFNSERGCQLYRQLLSQVLLSCTQQDIPVPDAIVQLDRKYRSGGSSQRPSKQRPNIIRDVCFRLLDLRSEIQNGNARNNHAIFKAAMEMDKELQEWKKSTPASWSYSVTHIEYISDANYFGGMRHEYESAEIIQVWNNWRTLRILVNRIMFTDAFSTPSDTSTISPSQSMVRDMATEICVSAVNLFGSPRAGTLIWPLFVVAEESSCSLEQRWWAVEQLRRINSTIGIRQAGLLADKAARALKELCLES